MPGPVEVLAILHEVGGHQQLVAGRGQGHPPAVVGKGGAPWKSFPDAADDGIFRQVHGPLQG